MFEYSYEALNFFIFGGKTFFKQRISSQKRITDRGPRYAFFLPKYGPL